MEDLPAMKTINLFCALTLFAAVGAAKAQNQQPDPETGACLSGLCRSRQAHREGTRNFQGAIQHDQGEIHHCRHPLAGTQRSRPLLQSGSFRLLHGRRFFPGNPGLHVPVRHPRRPGISRSGARRRFPMIPSRAATRAVPSPLPPPVPTRAPRSCLSISVTILAWTAGFRTLWQSD